jgi:endoglucanase
VVRIPVTWYEHLGPAPTYTIDPTWLSRVDAVVTYALNAGLYAVVNVHHDGADSSAAQWLNPSTTDQQGVTAEFTAVWTQIADHFQSFDNHLVFESMNEIHHGYATPDPSWTAFVNSLNQTFVTTVRGTGGNNASRFLDVPGYNTNIDITVGSFSLPKDTINNHLIVTYHYYDPSSFTISSTTHQWGAAYSGSDPCCNETYVVNELNKMQTSFIANGIPVMMGEYSATYQAGYESFRRYWTEYVTKAAHDRGIAPFYWDAGQDLIDRTNDALLYSDIMSALTRAATSSYTLSQIAPPQ